MVFGIAAALMVEVSGEAFMGWAGYYVSNPTSDVNHAGVLFGLLVVAATGAIDDVRALRPRNKFLGQIAGALIIVLSGVQLSAIVNPFGPGMIQFGIVAPFLTIFYLVAFMNVINLIDGLDGLAAGIAAIASVFFFIIALNKGFIETAMLSIILLGATTGFLRYNFNPASIFMGDCGSLTLGAMMAVISLLGMMRYPAVIIIAVPLVVAAIPIADTAAAIIRRLWNHQPIQQADRKHLHHILLDNGFSTRKSVLLVYLWTTILGVGALVISGTHGLGVLVVCLVLIAISFVFLWCIGMFGPVLSHHYQNKGSQEAADSVVVRSVLRGQGAPIEPKKNLFR